MAAQPSDTRWPTSIAPVGILRPPLHPCNYSVSPDFAFSSASRAHGLNVSITPCASLQKPRVAVCSAYLHSLETEVRRLHRIPLFSARRAAHSARNADEQRRCISWVRPGVASPRLAESSLSSAAEGAERPAAVRGSICPVSPGIRVPDCASWSAHLDVATSSCCPSLR